MNLKQLNDKDLLASTTRAVRVEKEALISVLRHIKEVDRRRLFSDLKYSSLCQWLMKEHGYSEFEAVSRISAMRLLEDLPEIEEKITSGEMTLTNLTYAQTLFRQEKREGRAYTQSEKLDVLKRLEGKSTREAKSITLSLSSKPHALRPDKITQVAPDKIEITLTANLTLEEKLKHIRGIKAHANPHASLGDIFEELADFYIQAKTCAHKKRCVTKTAVKPSPPNPAPPRPSRAAITRAVFAKANHRCEICSSTYALEEDHIIPEAKGGSDTLENLRLLCRHCNQRAAIKHFGRDKMARHMNVNQFISV